MNIAPVTPEDAPVLLHLAEKWGPNTFTWDPRAWGIVARDEDGIHGFALLCKRANGIVVDELWADTTLRGKRAMATIFAFCEANGAVGGIAKEGTPLYAVLRKRGYEIGAHVLVKEAVGG